MGSRHQLHGADSDIALDVGRHGCEQSDHSYGQGAPDELPLHFNPSLLRLRIFQIFPDDKSARIGCNAGSPGLPKR
jgi:hypothetical protein